MELLEYITEYIGELGFSELDWYPVDSETYETTDLVLLIVEYEGQLSIHLGKDMAGSFMTPDDLGWSGPQRNVVAWAEVALIDPRKLIT